MQLLGLLLLALSTSTFAKNCAPLPGVTDGECVGYYSGGSCTGEIGSYVPTCQGNCFQYNSFNSIHVAGDDTYGTSCTAYSDGNCQNSMGSTGNSVVAPGKCVSYPGVKSMRCYYRC